MSPIELSWTAKKTGSYNFQPIKVFTVRTEISAFIDLYYSDKLSPRERCYVFKCTWKGGDKEKEALTVKVTS